MCYSLLGCCHLANHSQLRFFWFIEYAILVIEIGYLTRLICMRIHFIFLFHCFIVLLTYSSMLFYCYFLTFGVDRGSPLVPGVRLCFTHIFLVDFRNYNAGRVDLADVLIYWFYTFGPINHMNHINFITFFEVWIQIWWSLLFHFLLRL